MSVLLLVGGSSFLLAISLDLVGSDATFFCKDAVAYFYGSRHFIVREFDERIVSI